MLYAKLLVQPTDGASSASVGTPSLSVSASGLSVSASSFTPITPPYITDILNI